MAAYSLTMKVEDVSGSTLFTNIQDTALLEAIFGAGYTNTTTRSFAFDRSIQRETKINTLTAVYGDGYEQRVKFGINPKKETIAIGFKNRTSNEIEVLSAFLDNKAGANFDVVLNDDTIKVASEQYSTTYSQDTIHSLTTQLRRVYEP